MPIDAWFSSTLKRSDETLTLIHQRQRNGSKQKFWGRTQLSSLNEIDYGRLEGRLRSDDTPRRGDPLQPIRMRHGVSPDGIAR